MGRVGLAVVVALAAARVAWLLWTGLDAKGGDFFATMPGGYAEWLNPSLWNSPDLSTSWAYQQNVYLYGPAQYLTLYPVVYWFDSFAAIARFLWVAYALTIALSALLIWRSVQLLQPVTLRTAAGLFCLTAFFFPLHRVFLQREFEIVVLGMTAAATYLSLRQRTAVAAALIGFVTWFKFLPLIWLPYFILRRWWTAVLAFCAMSAAVALLSVVLLGSEGLGAVWTVAQTQLAKRTDGGVMCIDWQPASHYSAVRNSTWIDAGWVACSLADTFPWLPARPFYLALLGLHATLFAVAFLRLEFGRRLDRQAERWRRGLEASLLIFASTTLVHAHYYYMSLLLVPLGLLLARYLSPTSIPVVRLTLLLIAYALLSVFAVPPSLTTRLLGFDVWWSYMRHLLYFPGQLLLAGLIYWEYFALSRPATGGPRG